MAEAATISSPKTVDPAKGTEARNANLAAALGVCIQKSRRNIVQLADKPKSWGSDPQGSYWLEDIDFFSIGNWTTSFHTGMALLAWHETEDEYFLRQVLRLEPLYRQKVNEHAAETMHDLGFLYSLFSVALYRLTGDKCHRETGVRAAEVLAKRFIPAGNYIQAWGRMDGREPHFQGLAIIDCLMNLPLLYWAARESGAAWLGEVAIRHADTTLKHFIRADDSVFHSFRFDSKTGVPLGGENYCGYSIDSHWARGTAWAIYGFALTHRYTGEFRFLDAAQRLARKFIAQLDHEVVPVWDFKLPSDSPKIRDSSAAAILVCALLEIIKMPGADLKMAVAADSLLNKLCSETYLDRDDSHPGVLKNAQTGIDKNVGVNAYASWGDYYLMEALIRKMGTGETFW